MPRNKKKFTICFLLLVLYSFSFLLLLLLAAVICCKLATETTTTTTTIKNDNRSNSICWQIFMYLFSLFYLNSNFCSGCCCFNCSDTWILTIFHAENSTRYYVYAHSGTTNNNNNCCCLCVVPFDLRWYLFIMSLISHTIAIWIWK